MDEDGSRRLAEGLLELLANTPSLVRVAGVVADDEAAKGRERLLDAIQSVQDEFALILVITHVEELKAPSPPAST